MAGSNKTTFSIEEIKRYLQGHKTVSKTLLECDYGLQNAIEELEHFQDGIEAVTERYNEKQN